MCRTRRVGFLRWVGDLGGGVFEGEWGKINSEMDGWMDGRERGRNGEEEGGSGR